MSLCCLDLTKIEKEWGRMNKMQFWIMKLLECVWFGGFLSLESFYVMFSYGRVGCEFILNYEISHEKLD